MPPNLTGDPGIPSLAEALESNIPLSEREARIEIEDLKSRRRFLRRAIWEAIEQLRSGRALPGQSTEHTIAFLRNTLKEDADYGSQKAIAPRVSELAQSADQGGSVLRAARTDTTVPQSGSGRSGACHFDGEHAPVPAGDVHGAPRE